MSTHHALELERTRRRCERHRQSPATWLVGWGVEVQGRRPSGLPVRKAGTGVGGPETEVVLH